MTGLEHIVATPTRVTKGQTLYRRGDRFTMLYAIRLGSFKTVFLSEDGHAQVTGYHMPGEILGSDGIGFGVHGCEAVALEDSEVCSISFARLEALARVHEGVQQNLHRVLAREIVRERRVLTMLGTMSAEQRVAAFLLDLSQEYATRGYSSNEFVLRMTREEIGSYLGLTLETVSRLLSRFQREGLMLVQGRILKLLNMPKLKKVMAC
jgi:CRP/FNR family transcriptional regulator